MGCVDMLTSAQGTHRGAHDGGLAHWGTSPKYVIWECCVTGITQRVSFRDWLMPEARCRDCQLVPTAWRSQRVAICS